MVVDADLSLQFDFDVQLTLHPGPGAAHLPASVAGLRPGRAGYHGATLSAWSNGPPDPSGWFKLASTVIVFRDGDFGRQLGRADVRREGVLTMGLVPLQNERSKRK
jgi:hypothetical protein